MLPGKLNMQYTMNKGLSDSYEIKKNTRRDEIVLKIFFRRTSNLHQTGLIRLNIYIYKSC